MYPRYLVTSKDNIYGPDYLAGKTPPHDVSAIYFSNRNGGYEYC